MASNSFMDALPHSTATTEQRQAYLLLRVLAGFDFFGHGFARIFTGSHLSGFAQGMVKSMASSRCPRVSYWRPGMLCRARNW